MGTAGMSRAHFHTAILLLALIVSGSWCRAEPSSDLASMHQQVKALYKSGKDAEGIALAEKAVALSEQIHGAESPAICDSLYLLARGFTRTAQYSKAEPIYLRVQRIREKVLGAEHPETATAIYNLAWFYANMANYVKAEELFQHALEIRRKQFGEESQWSAECLNALAVLNENKGNYAQSEKLYQEALRIQRKVLGANHYATATTLNNLASLYWTLGDYEQAERDFTLALDIRKKAFGVEHPDTATSLNNLALLYRSMGDYARAESLFKKVLSIRRKILGPQHAFTVTSINHLGLLYADMGQDAKAEPLLALAMDLREKTMGPNHPDTTRSYNDLALLYDRPKKYSKAEPLFLKALEGRKQVLGLRHPETALSLASLARHYHLLGKLAEAEPLYRDALEIQRATLGADHPDTLRTLESLAYLESETGRGDPALEHAREVVAGRERRFNSLFSFTSEQQRLELQKTLNLTSLPASLGSARDITQTLLRTKGLVLDSRLEDQLMTRASEDPELRALLDQLRDVSRRLMQGEPVTDDSGSDPAAREKLQEQQNQLQSAIARKIGGVGVARRALGIGEEQVRAAIPPGAVLIELLRYNHHLGKLQFESRYGAVVMSSEGESKWIVLGKAEEIENKIRLYQKYVRRNIKQSTMAKLLKDLGHDFWGPIEKAIPSGTRVVIISPDGEWNFVSFATLLLRDDRFFAEKCAIQYVSSGRDLLWRKPHQSESQEIAVFANPDFDGKTPRAGRGDDRMALGPLSGARREADFLVQHAPRWGLTANALLGARASEAALGRLKSPRILHMATHGFFIAEDEFPRVKFLQHPMQRSVLALAGAQTTFDAWNHGRIPATENDGVLTAEEVADLDLKNTWLVVLSACDTGSGEALAGEGVLGLRRGFIQAGTENLLMTLWPVGDVATFQIIQDFYVEAMKTGNAPQSLADVQRAWLVRLRKEQGLSMAVRLAGPFILTYQGRAE